MQGEWSGGKGSGRRPEDKSKFEEGYNRIWGNKEQEVSYSPDEQRVADYLNEVGGIGGGEDPIGFIIASHRALIQERQYSPSLIARIILAVDDWIDDMLYSMRKLWK